MWKLFWAEHLDNTEAMNLAVFWFGNEMPPHLLKQWLEVRGVKFNAKCLDNDVKRIMKDMDQMDPTKCRFFYFDLAQGEHCFMTGHAKNNITNSVKRPKESTLAK